MRDVVHHSVTILLFFPKVANSLLHFGDATDVTGEFGFLDGFLQVVDVFVDLDAAGVYAADLGEGELPVALEVGDLLLHGLLITTMGELGRGQGCVTEGGEGIRERGLWIG